MAFRVRFAWSGCLWSIVASVVLKVTDPSNLPSEVADGWEGLRGRQSPAVHEPDRVVAGSDVPPEQIGLAVTLQVAGARDHP